MHKTETVRSMAYTIRSIDCAPYSRDALIAKPTFTQAHLFISNFLDIAHKPATPSRPYVPTNVYAFPETKGAIGVPEISMPEGLRIQCDQEAWNFAESKGLLRVLMSYTALASKTFQLAGSPSCHFKHDPENEDEYLTIRLEVKGALEKVLDEEDVFRSRAIDLIPGDDLYLIRLSCVID